ncbi:MAG: hypothetical protein ACOY90_21300 [Candidatus Zhuqueibacterota bacterium]
MYSANGHRRSTLFDMHATPGVAVKPILKSSTLAFVLRGELTTRSKLLDCCRN